MHLGLCLLAGQLALQDERLGLGQTGPLDSDIGRLEIEGLDIRSLGFRGQPLCEGAPRPEGLRRWLPGGTPAALLWSGHMRGRGSRRRSWGGGCGCGRAVSTRVLGSWWLTFGCAVRAAVRNGHIKRITDQDIQSSVLEIMGTNVSTNYITCPADAKRTLGIKLPFLVMIIKNLKKYFTFEVQVLDDKNVRRRFRASNYQSTTRVKPFICTMPMRLDEGWNQIQFNLSDFTRRGTILHAQCLCTVWYALIFLNVTEGTYLGGPCVS